jgi:two-component system chemotaxis sensor kinase CheA
VHVQIGVAVDGWSPETTSLVNATSVVALAVSDTGIGIEVEHHQRIFEAFAQGDGTTARLYGGTGLGLAISRELVGLLGGELTLASTPGNGSTFTVYLPSGAPVTMAPPAFPVPVVRAPEGFDRQPESEFRGAKVLVVDDDFRNIFAMTALLERGHAHVTVAESGDAALAALDRDPEIDIVLMDIMMPVMDGYETIRAIRKSGYRKSLPIIAVTGKVMPGERQRCIDAGANDFVPKPVDTAQLTAVLRPWLPSLEVVA